MTGSPAGRHVAGFVLSGVLAGLALTGCTSPPAQTASPSPEATSAGPTPSATTPATAPASPIAAETPAPTMGETSAAATNSVTIDITIADGQMTPSGEKIDVEVGQTIVLNVTSDEHDEVHAHTDGDGYVLEVPAGRTVSGEFTLNSPGSYEVESHHLEKVIFVLNAR